LFIQVYGPDAFADDAKAYDKIAEAIAAFESSPVLKRFTSKYDYFLYGQAKLTEQELRGRRIFEDENKGNCAACHPSRPAADGTPPLFTDFTYDNLGVPKNPDNPFYALPAAFNPEGFDFIDKGLGGFLGRPAQDGKFKVPSLRNIALTAPYTHNGYFRTLRGVVDFYNSRDLKPRCPDDFTAEAQAIKNECWPAPEVERNVNREELGALNLTARDIDDLTAFLKTLSDGYREERPRLR